MDAACGADNWDVLLYTKGNNVLAALPYYIKRKWGLRLVVQPPLTQTNGIWINYPPLQKQVSRLSYEKETMRGIIAQLQRLGVALYLQDFHYAVTNWLPFYWSGFKQTTRYTYVLEELNTVESLYAGLRYNIRHEIKKAQSQVTIKDDCPLADFYALHRETFARKGWDTPISFAVLQRIDQACLRRNCRKILYAADGAGTIHAAAYLVWDENSAYYLLAGVNPRLKSSGANSLLVWNAIRFAGNVTRKFDFEGTMLEPIERFFSGFGAVPKPYFRIYKSYLIHPDLWDVYQRLKTAHKKTVYTVTHKLFRNG